MDRVDANEIWIFFRFFDLEVLVIIVVMQF